MVQNDVVTGVSTANGMQYHLMVPGHGAVLLDVGHQVFQYSPDFATVTLVFSAGPHQVQSGDTAGLCAALA